MKSITIRGKRKTVRKVHSHPGRFSPGRVHYAIASQDPMWGRVYVTLCGYQLRNARLVAADVYLTCDKCRAKEK